MSIFDTIGMFLFPNNGNSTGEEEKQEEKERQKKVLELMQMYQQYHGRIQEKQYALRGSTLACEYGTKYAQFDCVEDHGIMKNKHPIFTAIDCLRENIHNFGSCLCPETSYKERLPMTVAVDSDGNVAKKAEGNDFPHICIPIIDEEHGWLQTEKNVMVQIDEQEYAQMLMSSAVLVCQYGGIIGILEVPDVEETNDKKWGVTLEQLEEFNFFIGLDEAEEEKGVAILNDVLQRYDITTNEQIAAFMGQVAQESEFGKRTLERFTGNNPEQYFNDRYSWRTDLGNMGGNDGELYRGSGYMHLTGRYNYQKFGEYIGKEEIVMTEGYRIIGGVYNQDIMNLPPGTKGFIDVGEYAWESAGWFWKYGNPTESSLNKFVENHDWTSISKMINQGDPDSYPLREQNTKYFYQILTGEPMDAS